MSLKELSNEIGVSEVTILNFCKNIGNESFVHFKKEIQNFVKEELDYPAEIRSSLDELKSKEEAYENSINMHRENTEQIIKVNDLDNIDRIASLIIKSRKIFICGQGISRMIADYFSARIRLLSLDASIIDISDMISLSVELNHIESNDLFFLISFPNYNRNVIALSRFLYKKNIGFVALTDNLRSPIVEHAEFVLQCDSKALVFQNSLSSPMFLLEILMDTLSYKIKDKLMSSFERVDEVQKLLIGELSSD